MATATTVERKPVIVLKLSPYEASFIKGLTQNSLKRGGDELPEEQEARTSIFEALNEEGA